MLNEKPFNDAAFELLFKENFAALCGYCQYKYDFDIDQSKEIVHSGFIKLWENRNNLDQDSSVKPYLYTILNNLSLDFIRHEKIKEKHQQFVLNRRAIAEDFCPLDMKELTQEIEKSILELPDQMRIIFEMSRYQGLKYAEISEKLNISVKTVETQMSRALAKLRIKLSKYLSFIIPTFL